MVDVSIIGNLVNDPTSKEVNGSQCCNFKVAAQTTRKGEDGKYIAQFWHVSVWGKRGEMCMRYLKKGYKVYCSGEPSFSMFTGRDGENKMCNNLSAINIDFLSNGGAHDGETKKASGDLDSDL